MKATRAFGVCLLIYAMLSAGCISGIGEEGSPCPCGPGWKCCNVDDVCVREGDMCLTEEQNLLLALEGTWVGTADDANTASGSKRIEIRISLPPGGASSFNDISGTIRFGMDVGPPVVDPDDPGLDVYNEDSLLDGFVFDILKPAFVNGRMLLEYKPVSQWVDFCNAQSVLYLAGPDAYCCAPPWPGQCIDHICTFENPEGGELQMKESKKEVCFSLCVCDEFSCILREKFYSNRHMDLTIDVDDGLMLGTGDDGTVQAVRQ
jgi:hypothetical protein